MSYAAWLEICDRLAGLWAEGRMTDDFPEFDWLGAYEWGDTPDRAVRSAIALN